MSELLRQPPSGSVHDHHLSFCDLSFLPALCKYPQLKTLLPITTCFLTCFLACCKLFWETHFYGNLLVPRPARLYLQHGLCLGGKKKGCIILACQLQYIMFVQIAGF